MVSTCLFMIFGVFQSAHANLHLLGFEVLPTSCRYFYSRLQYYLSILERACLHAVQISPFQKSYRCDKLNFFKLGGAVLSGTLRE